MNKREFEKKLEELVSKMIEEIEKIDRKTFTKCTCIDYDYSLCPGCQAFADAKNEVEKKYNALICTLKNKKKEKGKMKGKKYYCDWGHELIGYGKKNVVKRLPLVGNSAIFVCHKHYLEEIKFRKARNKGLADEVKFDIPRWEELEEQE